jgi:integrase/recombinase XerD
MIYAASAPFTRGLADLVPRNQMATNFGRRGMNVEDYYVQGRRSWVRLHEKGGKQHDMPAHHLLENYVDAYLTEAGITSDKHTPLFRTAAGKTGTLTERRMTRTDALRMIWRRARAAGIETERGRPSFRATGITVYLRNGGLLTTAASSNANQGL